jgi:hypothetical protein
VEPLWCLIIRQPYASLIVDGAKRWEFRSYPPTTFGKIGIAAAKGTPLRTYSNSLNRLASRLPRGLVLGTAHLLSYRLCTNETLLQYVHRTTELNLFGSKIMIVDSPIGEPLEDVVAATKNAEWRSYAWELSDISPLDEPLLYSHVGRGTWGMTNLT